MNLVVSSLTLWVSPEVPPPLGDELHVRNLSAATGVCLFTYLNLPHPLPPLNFNTQGYFAVAVISPEYKSHSINTNRIKSINENDSTM